jgi:hypothetical protein
MTQDCRCPWNGDQALSGFCDRDSASSFSLDEPRLHARAEVGRAKAKEVVHAPPMTDAASCVPNYSQWHLVRENGSHELTSDSWLLAFRSSHSPRGREGKGKEGGTGSRERACLHGQQLASHRAPSSSGVGLSIGEAAGQTTAHPCQGAVELLVVEARFSTYHIWPHELLDGL